jgi:hypothetical protein
MLVVPESVAKLYYLLLYLLFIIILIIFIMNIDHRAVPFLSMANERFYINS